MNLREQAAGRWADIFPAFGIPAKVLNRRNQPCPICGGKDRFRCTNLGGAGSWICNNCGTGDGIGLVMLKKKWTFEEARAAIEPLVGGARVVKDKPSTFDRRGALNGLWASGTTVTLDTPAGRFLNLRTGMVEFPPCLRAVASMRHWGEDKVARFYPGFVAMVTGPDGAPENLYRTWVERDGSAKAPLTPPRMMMPGAVRPGSAVRLWPAGEVLGVGEGIETCISKALNWSYAREQQRSVWAVLGTAGMASFMPPPGVKHLMVFGDNDANFAGQAAAYALGHRMVAYAARLDTDLVDVDVLVPRHATTGEDWNDVHRPVPGDFD